MQEMEIVLMSYCHFATNLGDLLPDPYPVEDRYSSKLIILIRMVDLLDHLFIIL